MAVSLPPSYRPLPPCPPRRPIVNQLSERGRDPRAPDIAHRDRDNLRASTGKAVATVLTLCTRWSGVASLATRHLRVHEHREKRLLGGSDDRDLPTPAALPARAAVPAGASRTSRTTGTARLPVRARDARGSLGTARATRAARFDDEPIGRPHGARIGKQVVRRRFLDFNAGHEEPIVERRLQDPQPHGHLRTAGS